MELCPKCGRGGFTSASGRTLHIKNCKGPKSTDPTVPCPKCGKDTFSSNSGRTLHIKNCKGIEKKEFVCHCGKVFDKQYALTNHSKACKFEGSTYDSVLKVQIRGKVNCSCPANLREALKCTPILSVKKSVDMTLGSTCWIEGWGPCVYATGITSDKDVSLPCKERNRYRYTGGSKKAVYADPNDLD